MDGQRVSSRNIDYRARQSRENERKRAHRDGEYAEECRRDDSRTAADLIK